MAAELVTPVDEFTGLPHAIAPSLIDLPLDDSDIADDHHGIHPSSDPRLKTLAGRGLRNSWIERTEKQYHNYGPYAYHRYYKGPTLPREEEFFSQCVIASACPVVSWVIDMSRGEPVERRTRQEELEYFRTPHPDDPYSYKYIGYRYVPIRDFFRSHVLAQDLSQEETVVDEFLSTDDFEQKRYLGHLLLAKAAEVATDSVREKYLLLRSARMLHPLMPPQPQTLVKHKLGTPEQREELIPVMEISLRKQYGLVAA